jgi:hypothetical protein
VADPKKHLLKKKLTFPYHTLTLQQNKDHFSSKNEVHSKPKGFSRQRPQTNNKVLE